MGIDAVARPFLHAHLVLKMEAEACKVGLLLGIHQGWTNIDIESDSATLVAALKSEEKDLLEVSRVISDCKSYFSVFQSIRIRHVYREANGVANRLAHLASICFINNVWLEETHDNIQDVLYDDYNYCLSIVRGLGTMSAPPPAATKN
ncbi:hypothetical protein ACLB2K_043812 [Fragaria x ananassa]